MLILLNVEHGIQDVTKVVKDKKEFNKIVKQACKKDNERDLKAEVERFKKLNAIKYEDCHMKVYVETVNLENVMILFKQEEEMTKCAKNYEKLV